MGGAMEEPSYTTERKEEFWVDSRKAGLETGTAVNDGRTIRLNHSLTLDEAFHPTVKRMQRSARNQ
jgi:hypothetical protein